MKKLNSHTRTKLNSRTKTIHRRNPIPVQHRAASKSSSKWVVIATSVISLLSASGLIASLAMSRHSDFKQAEEFKASSNEASKSFESQRGKFIKQIDYLQVEKKDLTATLSRSKEENNKLSENLRVKERELLETKDDLERAKVLSNNNPTRKLMTPSNLPQPSQPSIPPSEAEKTIAWSKRNTTMVFPISLNVAKDPVIVRDREKKVTIPVLPGGKVIAIGYHPSSPKYLVVSLPHSKKFLASMTIGNTNFVEVIHPIFQKHAERVAQK
jgi:hypothetical protein